MWLSDFIFKYVDNGTPIKVLYVHKHREEVLFEFANADEAKFNEDTFRQIGGYIVYAVSVEDNTLILYVD